MLCVTCNLIFVGQLQTLLSLSEDQVQDLMLLRRLFIVKRCLLGSQRARLVARMQKPSPDLISDALKASSVATQLGNNAAQDRQLFHRFTWGVYCGVSHELNAGLCESQAASVRPSICMLPAMGKGPCTVEACFPISCAAHLGTLFERICMKVLSAVTSAMTLQAACLLLA